MKHPVVAVIAGLAVWVIVTTAAGAIMRAAWPDYAAVADAMTFTLPMMLARLSIGGLATLAAGWVAAVVSRRSALAAATTGLTLLVLFIPQHMMLWARFPVWYHLSFLLSLGSPDIPGRKTRDWLAERAIAQWHRSLHASKG